MIPSIENIRSLYMKMAQYKEELKEIYTMMDASYKVATDFYGFKCLGCENNCCYTHFYHHSFLETFYLFDGLDTLTTKKRSEVKQRSDEVCRMPDQSNPKSFRPKRLCPLNSDSLCILYPYRPMICRLHGLPHELNRPEQGIRRYPGCDYFMKHHAHQGYFNFDRTSIYMEVANLEREFRQKAGVTDKIKMTVAEMIDMYDF